MATSFINLYLSLRPSVATWTYYPGCQITITIGFVDPKVFLRQSEHLTHMGYTHAHQNTF